MYFIGFGVNFLGTQIFASVVRHTLPSETYSYYSLNKFSLLYSIYNSIIKATNSYLFWALLAHHREVQ